MEQISPRVYTETKRRGANTSIIVTSEGVVLIDAPHKPSDAMKWREEVVQKGEVRYLINTEHHMDHCVGDYFFSGTVVAHEETRERIKSTPLEQIKERILQIDPGAKSLIADYQLRVPTIAFSERMTLYVGDRTFHLIHLPGHTSGEIAIHVPEERVLFTGDNIFHKVQAFLHEAVPFQWLESLKKIEGIDVDVIVPGHGEPCDRSYVPEMASFIQEWIDAARAAIKQGLSKEEAMEKISFAGRYPMDAEMQDMAATVQRWNVERLYNLLTAPPD
ncbi:MBL fold metallo-hydrolase [Chloroflexota bacterium]